MVPELSLVLPAFEASQFIAGSVRELHAFLRSRTSELALEDGFEILVVDDGSSDGTAAAVPCDMRETHCVRLPRNRGKGAAVRAGMLAARGRYRIFTDCDLPYELDAIGSILRELRMPGCALCIGARDLPDSTFQLQRGLHRRLASFAFTLWVSQISLRGFLDSQCGMKGFSADAAATLFGASAVNGFAFDVEILYLAHKLGMDIRRVPVHFVRNAPSSLRLTRDSARMLADVVRIPLRYHLRRWRRG